MPSDGEVDLDASRTAIRTLVHRATFVTSPGEGLRSILPPQFQTSSCSRTAVGSSKSAKQRRSWKTRRRESRSSRDQISLAIFRGPSRADCQRVIVRDMKRAFGVIRVKSSTTYLPRIVRAIRPCASSCPLRSPRVNRNQQSSHDCVHDLE